MAIQTSDTWVWGELSGFGDLLSDVVGRAKWSAGGVRMAQTSTVKATKTQRDGLQLMMKTTRGSIRQGGEGQPLVYHLDEMVYVYDLES